MINYPKEAIISVTLNCNARCVMCNIWQNKITKEVVPEFYKRLPQSLEEINLTGGEPFLRNDLPEIVRVIKNTCPKARLLINTNGYLTNQIKKLMPQIKKHDKRIAVRVSLDGLSDTHKRIRGLPLFFEHAMDTLNFLRQLGIEDLGVSYTLMEQSKHDLLKLYDYCEKNKLEFSLTVVTDSPIYFGTGKVSLRPRVDEELTEIFTKLTNQQYKSNNPKNWIRAWFNQKLLDFIDRKTRYFNCNAGEDFFYLDSLGKVYNCHLKSWQMGDLNKHPFEKIWFSKRANVLREKAKSCHDCWMVCTARNMIKKKFAQVLKEVIINKLSAQFLT